MYKRLGRSPLGRSAVGAGKGIKSGDQPDDIIQKQKRGPAQQMSQMRNKSSGDGCSDSRLSMRLRWEASAGSFN